MSRISDIYNVLNLLVLAQQLLIDSIRMYKCHNANLFAVPQHPYPL